MEIKYHASGELDFNNKHKLEYDERDGSEYIDTHEEVYERAVKEVEKEFSNFSVDEFNMSLVKDEGGEPTGYSWEMKGRIR